MYDNRGRPTLHVAFEGVVTEFRYHPQSGQLSQQRFFDNLTRYANGQGTAQEVWSFTSDAFGRLVRVEQTTDDYDHTGIRVSVLHEVDSNGDGAWDQRTRTDYLNDLHNHTGYSQILRETHLDATTGVVQKRIDYTLGLDEIAQTTTTYDAAGNVVSRETLVFGHDGHGSVRLLFDLAGAIAQLYVYEAYGQLAAIYNAAGQFVSANPADARTTILHDGEPFDNHIGWGYRRARWVDPHIGRFNRLDPFFGNLWDPQSFHKYLFTHADPINGIDPSGLEFTGSTGQLVAIGVSI
ncbi:MAG TPA: RHS repeat-associated core domain-containing protein [Gemmataceae bacterium]|nr:RHS repeat-associated core domain-containing protein [Gemmataceae bacterium]